MHGRNILVSLTTIAIFLIICIYINSQRELLVYISNISPYRLIILVFLIMLFQMVNGLILKDIAHLFDIRLSAREWLGLPFVTSLWNYITPFSGGMAARASYLKYRHDFAYARFISVLAATYVLFFGIACITGVSILLISNIGDDYFLHLFLFFISILVAVIFVALIPLGRLRGNNRYIEAFNHALEGWDMIRNDYMLLARLALYSLASIVVNGVTFWMALTTLSDRVFSFSGVFLISILSCFTLLVRITPGNFGISEGVVGLCSGMIGIGTGIGLMTALLIRAVSLIPIVLLGVVFSIVFTKELSAHANITKTD